MVLIHQKMASIAGNLPPWTDSKRFAWRQQHVFLFFSPGWSCHPLKENGSCKKKNKKNIGIDWNQLQLMPTGTCLSYQQKLTALRQTCVTCLSKPKSDSPVTRLFVASHGGWKKYEKNIWRKINNFSQKLTLMFSLSFLPRFSTSAWMSGAGSSVWGRRDHQNMTGKFFHFYRCSQL